MILMDLTLLSSDDIQWNTILTSGIDSHLDGGLRPSSAQPDMAWREPLRLRVGCSRCGSAAWAELLSGHLKRRRHRRGRWARKCGGATTARWYHRNSVCLCCCCCYCCARDWRSDRPIPSPAESAPWPFSYSGRHMWGSVVHFRRTI